MLIYFPYTINLYTSRDESVHVCYDRKLMCELTNWTKLKRDFIGEKIELGQSTALAQYNKSFPWTSWLKAGWYISIYKYSSRCILR